MISESFETGGKTFTVRRAIDSDKQGFMDLWRECFDDTEEFINFFFSERFIPEFSFCVECGGVIVSAMQSMPLSIIIRGKKLPATIVAGVSTSHEHRRLGLMRKMFVAYMHYVKSKGILAVTYKPENFGTYEFLSHYSTTCTLKYTVSKAFPGVTGSPLHTEFLTRLTSDEDLQSDNTDLEEIVISGKLKNLQPAIINKCFKLYSLIAPSYSGIVDRTNDNFKLKLSDYKSSGGKFLMLFEGNSLLSYCFYFETPNLIQVEEFISETDTVLLKLLDRLHEIANGRKLSVKIPSNFSRLPESSFPDSDNVTLTDQNVLGITDLSEFLKTLNLDDSIAGDLLYDFVFEISDPVFKENNGKFLLNGNKSEGRPFIKLDIGSMVRFLCGYYSIADLETYTPDKVEIANREIAERLDETILTCDCFIVDEY